VPQSFANLEPRGNEPQDNNEPALHEICSKYQIQCVRPQLGEKEQVFTPILTTSASAKGKEHSLPEQRLFIHSFNPDRLGVVLLTSKLTPGHERRQRSGSLAFRQVAVKQSVTVKVISLNSSFDASRGT
jgi:hypothetical protein